MPYDVEISPLAQRQIRKLERDVQRLIISKLEELRKEPRPAGVKKLVGTDNLYRVRVGQYRIVYAIEDAKFVILVVKVADRKDVYRDR